MKQEFEVVGEAIRVECDTETDEVLIVFRLINGKYKQMIKANWAEDIEFRIVDKKLVLSKG